MATKPCSPLHQRMINDMTVRNFVPDIQREYVRAVKNQAIFLERSPDTATAEDLRCYQVHLNETDVRPPMINEAVMALRFFFKVTVDHVKIPRLFTEGAKPHPKFEAQAAHQFTCWRDTGTALS